ncbi:autophagy-related protein [Trichosporon asahii var. asahii CBS 8904]|uniref:Autophagy-related protein 3 n=1 Tax=Trichosporon asahii var. asahii (strain CBS 8904) TaxID=1220162 RepID=K1WXT3_TRIAC|nr:autophagy-related protein [Trichosporon asahii var. asahii CBS 8904]
MNSSLLAIQYWAVRDYLSPVLRESKFKEHGRITPGELHHHYQADRAEEFVAAGDFLTFKFPVWQWEKGDPGRARDFLPADKQYLITRNETNTDTVAEIPDSPSLTAATQGLHIGDDDEIPDMDDIPDMDEAAGLEEEDDAAVRPSENSSDNLLQVRTYDCYISYDKHYQTPRFWLFGYDEHKKPLTVKEIFQDVPADHAFKTMTMEAFPHSGTQLASVHPCKHASVMKKFIDRMEESTAEVPPPGKDGRDGKDKRRWLPGVMRKVTGSDKKGASGGSTPHGDEEAGVRSTFIWLLLEAIRPLDLVAVRPPSGH